ncbi:MAG: hypothetical protein M1831_004255 [Alyxoria varia]|nr:MAG: hypothetical protein M1831_004255 [Alyxoria varia]
MSTDDRIIIGIDFGTTFTGVAFVYSGEDEPLANRIQVIQQYVHAIDFVCASNIETPNALMDRWPKSKHNSSAMKIPTEVSYDVDTLEKDKPLLTRSARDIQKLTSSKRDHRAKHCLWGHEINSLEPRVQCFKLCLDSGHSLPDYVSPEYFVAQLNRNNRRVIDVVTDYLSKVNAHINDILRDRFRDPDFIKNTDKEYILTVPAMWSPAAKSETIKAAARAGMGKHKDPAPIVSEPEAAALYAISSIKSHSLREEDNIVICDAGGGTVDLISYTVTSMSPLRLEELVEGNGGLCGAAFLNFRFGEKVAARFGPERFRRLQTEKPMAWQVCCAEFEDHAKKDFAGVRDNEVFRFPLPNVEDNADVGIEQGFLKLDSTEMYEIFEPVVEDVIALAERQVEAIRELGKEVSALLLVGGFGQSRYLHTRLKENFNAATKNYVKAEDEGRNKKGRRRISAASSDGVPVLQCSDAWTAVVKGAVMRGLDPSTVTSRRCRSHFGFRYNAPYVPGLHPKKSRFTQHATDEVKARDAMRWLVRKGDAITSCMTFPFVQEEYFPGDVRGGDLNLEVALYSCLEDAAPLMYSGRRMRRVCKTSVDLSKVPGRQWRKYKVEDEEKVEGTLDDSEEDGEGGGKGGTKVYKMVPLSVVMKIDTARIGFEVKNAGQVYGDVSTTF